MWEHDLQTDRLIWDEGMFALTGVARESFSGRGADWLAIVHPDDLPAMTVRAQDAIDGAMPTEYRFRIVRPDGAIRWIAARSDMIKDPDGGAHVMVGVSYDVTEREEAERAAREAARQAEADRDRLIRLTSNSPAASFEYRHDVDGKISWPFFSGNMPGILGVSGEAIRDDGQAAFVTVHPDDLGHLVEAIETSQATLRPFSARYRIRHPALGARWIRADSLPVREPDGATHWFGNLHDVTELEESERRALQAADDLSSANEALREAKAALERQALLLRTATSHGNVGLWSANVATGDAWWNETVGRWTGLPCAENLNDTASVLAYFVHPDDAPGFGSAVAAALAHPTGHFEFPHRQARSGGGWRHVTAVGSVIRNIEGEPVLHGALIDVHDVVEKERALERALADARDAHHRLDTLTESVPGGLYEFVLHADGRMTVPYANEAALRIFGSAFDELRGDARIAFRRIDPEDLVTLNEAIAVSAATLEPFGLRLRWKTDEGVRWLSLQSRPERRPDGSTVWYGALLDVTTDIALQEALQYAQRESAYLARHDGLTDLPNRRYFDEEIARLLAQGVGQATGPALSIIRIDLDHFKAVNDTLGHEAGDAVLVHVARHLKTCKRPEDFAARVGGDEFVVMLLGEGGQSNADIVDAFVARLRSALAEPLLHDGRICRFGVSIGVAHSDLIADDPSRLITYADVALYETKALGRGGTTLYTPELHRQSLEERREADDVLTALEDAQIVPYFQVQVCARTGGLRGFEVLARWAHPERGILPPSAFLGTAARLGKQHLVDRAVFAKALDVFRQCKGMGLHIPKLSFNVSAPRLHDRDFVQGLIAAQNEGVQIAVELLESILLEDVDSHIQFNLDTLRDYGVQIEVDDFGSGRASIVGVMRVNPDRIKLDQQIVLPLTVSREMRKLVRHIIGIADSLGVRITAEGVESAEHVRILRDLGADTLQGYHFGRPCDADALVAMLEDLRATGRQAVGQG
jgi:diguanylate cyclase (GGDEF)-like protein/PAS domain S-box-containing protein